MPRIRILYHSTQSPWHQQRKSSKSWRANAKAFCQIKQRKLQGTKNACKVHPPCSCQKVPKATTCPATGLDTETCCSASPKMEADKGTPCFVTGLGGNTMAAGAGGYLQAFVSSMAPTASPLYPVPQMWHSPRSLGLAAAGEVKPCL